MLHDKQKMINKLFKFISDLINTLKRNTRETKPNMGMIYG